MNLSTTLPKTPASPTDLTDGNEPISLTGEVLTNFGVLPLQQWEDTKRLGINKSMNCRQIRGLEKKTIFQLKRLARFPLIKDVIEAELNRRLERKKA